MLQSKIKYILLILICISCQSRNSYIAVPNNSIEIYNPWTLNWFSCINCQSNYDLILEDCIFENKLWYIPLPDELYKDSTFLYKLHNTFLSIGYKSLLSKEAYSTLLKPFIDSLYSYRYKEIDTNNYYFKFIQRRKSQGTESIMFSILGDIKNSFQDKPISDASEVIFDTLAGFIKTDLALKSATDTNKKQVLLESFNYLISIQQYHLAYKLMYLPQNFNTINISKDSLLKTLPLDTIKYANFSDSLIRLGYYDKNSVWNDEYIYWFTYPGP